MKPRVLFVDDEKNILLGLRRSLHTKRKDWDMHFACGGKEALDLLSQHSFEVIVTDMRMPEIDGAELLRQVAADYPATVRFILSGQSDREATYRAIGSSHQFFSKPCDIDELIKMIDRNLALRSQLSAGVCRYLTSLAAIPSPAGMRSEIRAMLNPDAASIGQVAQLVKRDIGMTMKVLQLTNSTYFGHGGNALCPELACRMLDFPILTELLKISEFSVSVDDEAKEHRLSQFHDVMNARMELSLCDQMLEGADKDARNLLRMKILLQTIPEFVACQMEDEKVVDEANTVIRYAIGLWGLPDRLLALFDDEMEADPVVMTVRSQGIDTESNHQLNVAA